MLGESVPPEHRPVPPEPWMPVPQDVQDVQDITNIEYSMFRMFKMAKMSRMSKMLTIFRVSKMSRIEDFKSEHSKSVYHSHHRNCQISLPKLAKHATIDMSQLSNFCLFRFTQGGEKILQFYFLLTVFVRRKKA